MSTNLEYRARERQRKRESRRQASEAQREKGRQRSRARDKKQRRHFFVGRTTWKFCSGNEKVRNASGTNARWKWAVVKKSEREHVRHFLHKTCNYVVGSFWKFHLVVVKNNGKEMLVQKKCAAHAKLLFFTVLRRCLRRLALYDFIFCWINYKYYRELPF